MGYNSNTGVMSGSISHSDLRNMLGVAYKTNRELCRAASVNPKSRYKPVEYAASTGPLGESQFKAANWGYRIPPITRIGDYMSYVVNGATPSGWESPASDARSMGYGWYYIKPVTWYRLQDFNKYNHKTSAALFSDIIANSSINQNTSSLIVQFNRGTFALNEFGDLADHHLGVIIAKEGSTTAFFKTIVDSGADANHPTITFTRAEMNRIFVSGYGNYKIYAVATTDNAQNINNSASYYATSFSLRPLVVSPATVNYQYQGVTSADIAFHITNLLVDYQEISFDLYASNTGDAAGSVGKANIRYDVNALDDSGNEYNKGLANLDSSGGSVSVPVGSSRVKIGSYTVPYAAYRQLSPPWFATLKIYYPNSAGTSVLYTSMGDTYE